MQNQSELDALAEELTLRREVDKFGTIRYYNSNNQIHRISGPAVIYADGPEYWYQNGRLHRLDGLAIIWSGGGGGWFINDIRYSEEEFNAHPLVIAHKSKIAL